MAKAQKEKKRPRTDERVFYSWLDTSPWLTILISTLLDSLIILVIILTFGPCILNRSLTFIKECSSTVKVMTLRSQYHLYPGSRDLGATSKKSREWGTAGSKPLPSVHGSLPLRNDVSFQAKQPLWPLAMMGSNSD